MRFLAALGIIIAATLGPAYAAEIIGGAHSQPQRVQMDSLTPKQRMAARFPQDVLVAALVGIPIQDYDDRVLGHVSDVVRKPDGDVILVMPEGGWFGRGGRPVGIPLETVAILGRHLNLLDMPREDVPKLPTWNPADGAPIARDRVIKVAIGRR
jgi:hypothetical protein